MQISVWEAESFYSHKNIIIVGAGLAGLWTALEINKKRPQLKILLLDKGLIPAGASTRNAGFACFGSPTEMWNDTQTMGLDKVLEMAEMRYRGINKIRSHFGDAVIDYDDCGGYELLGAGFNDEALDERLAELNGHLQGVTGKEATFEVKDKNIKKFIFNGFNHLVENKLEGGLHSGKLVQALTKKVLSLGIEIITQAEVTRWQMEKGVTKVATKQGIGFSCDRLVLCTNGFTGDIYKQADVVPGRGQVIVTSPIEKLPFRGTFHYDGGFYYFRNLGNRVLLGGARNKDFAGEATNKMETSNLIQNELFRFLSEQILPGREFTIDYSWSGIMAFTSNHQPLVETIGENVLAVVACNGMGVALTPIIAEKVAVLVTA